MKKIKLSKGKYALVDDKDYDQLSKVSWHFNDLYATRGLVSDGKLKTIYLHRFIANTPKGMETDHINQNKLDNRRENLRICTSSQNRTNKGKRGRVI